MMSPEEKLQRSRGVLNPTSPIGPPETSSRSGQCPNNGAYFPIKSLILLFDLFHMLNKTSFEKDRFLTQSSVCQ